MEFDFTLEDLLATLAVYGHDGVVRGGGEWMRTMCPFHDVKTPSASVSDSGIFVCHAGCDPKGNPLNVIMKAEGIDFASALQKYEKITNQRIDMPQQRRPSVEGKLDKFMKNFPDWFKYK